MEIETVFKLLIEFHQKSTQSWLYIFTTVCIYVTRHFFPLHLKDSTSGRMCQKFVVGRFFFCSKFGGRLELVNWPVTNLTGYLEVTNWKLDKGPSKNYVVHRWSDSTVIKRRQQQLGRMADFLPSVTFSVFDL